MIVYKPAPDLNRVKEVLGYDPETGIFTWLIKTCRKVTIGKIAGSIKRSNPKAPPYLQISIDGVTYKAHTLAYYIVTGEWLPGKVDHKDGNSLNNKWENYRIATRSEQNRNMAKHRDGACLYKGISFCKIMKRYTAEIMKDRVKYKLGYFDTQEEAAEAYRLKSLELHGEFSTVREVKY